MFEYLYKFIQEGITDDSWNEYVQTAKSLGYEELVEALKKPRSKRAKEIKEWLGYDFDPTDFDFEGVSAMVDDYNETDDY